ncbi:MAG: 1-acyl-sn-glycerol-3-phosphate acyltransferase [Bacteroidetes bacterium]|nr:MAG: 1-acyl-sn-glycerol-3-phosphate acyltransferase [Bacteroidota bacterium]
MTQFSKPLQWIYCIYAFVLFVTIMLLLFPCVLIASFFGRIRGGNAIFRICMFWGDLWFPLVFIFPRRIYTSPHDKTKQYVFVLNHTSLLDAAVIPKAFRQPVRPLGKAEMSKIPVFGFIYRKAIVMVNRSSATDRFHSLITLRSIIGKGISVLFFPEGTYNQTHQPLKAFFDGAFRIAIETQTPVKPVLFLDNYNRLPYQHALSFNPGRCRILFLDEIPVSGLTAHDADKLKENVFHMMENKLREYKVGWIR